MSFTSLRLHRDTPFSRDGPTCSVEVCLPHLHTLELLSDMSSFLTLMAHLSLPQLAALCLETYASESNLHEVELKELPAQRESDIPVTACTSYHELP